ncbi:MAG: methyltransferase, partial [Candidatus Cloacimonetes bacterium]|nr:methyltransferase [Candidatus Cloacimonadota bacterium]
MCYECRREKGEEASVFYDEWYARGYMDEWPAEEKQRVLELVKSLDLGEKGDVLDLGCGNGEFTGVLKKALPKWNVYGTDISAIAIENAQKRHSDCSFFLTSDNCFINKKFDILFTHHVLEHVDDIDKIWAEIDQYLKKRAFALHILPCGNQGSFEYNLCMLK